MNKPNGDKEDALGSLTEQFFQEIREGLSPSIETYAYRYPEHADDIREIFPAFELLEHSGMRHIHRDFPRVRP